ncbi:glycosyltransferase 87 family protein [Catellatospora vulcania]|uniref:glycosyltransferase 87 family protein n=1 Tax=Catellatospora vulcania TaxID=1460450 RepID=UPI0012D40CD4|nr:glycosyltransferase 87 family protein [Catellatospora vulcania]
MVIQRLRQFAADAAVDHTERPRVTVPAWLLVPGLAVLAGALALFVLFLRDHRFSGTDFSMYVGAARAFLDGQPVYQLGYTGLHLPYTYPPVTLPFLVPATWIDERTALYCMNAVSFAAMLAAVWLTTRMVGFRGTAGRVGIVAAIGAAVLWSEPLYRNMNMGQINVLVMLLVVADLALSDRSRFKGIGIGAATAVKLLPGLFVVYLLLTRRIRAAFVAAGTFLGLTLIGFAVDPGGSVDYWIDGRAFDTSRVLMGPGPRYGGNQSLQGFTARLLGTNEQNTIWWMLSALVVAVAGMALAVAVQRRGEEAMAMIIVGFTTLLISPVSWSHYWLWIGPAAVVLIDVVRRVSGRARLIPAAVALAVLLPFALWPTHDRSGEFLPTGLIWGAWNTQGLTRRLFVDPYVPAALLLFALAAVWLYRLTRKAAQAAVPTGPAADAG